MDLRFHPPPRGPDPGPADAARRPLERQLGRARAALARLGRVPRSGLQALIVAWAALAAMLMAAPAPPGWTMWMTLATAMSACYAGLAPAVARALTLALLGVATVGPGPQPLGPASSSLAVGGLLALVVFLEVMRVVLVRGRQRLGDAVQDLDAALQAMGADGDAGRAGAAPPTPRDAGAPRGACEGAAAAPSAGTVAADPAALHATEPGEAPHARTDGRTRHDETATRDPATAATALPATPTEAMLANLHHELRTPMNAILGMSHLALQGPLEDRQRQYLEHVQRSARGLMGLLDDLLDVRAPASAMSAAPAQVFELGQLLDDLRLQTGRAALDKRLLLHIHHPAGLPDRLLGDATQLTRVLRQLVDNALKFTDLGEVEVGAEAVSRSASTLTLHCWVRDTGPGIPRERLETLFDQPGQGDDSITRRHGGLGLGLAACARWARQLGGSLWAESVVGTGSTFHVQVPLDVDAEARLPAPAQQRPGFGRQVLVVDADPVSRATAVRLAAELGCDARGAAGSEDLLSLGASLGELDLLLVDELMPGQDGLACVQQIGQAGWLPAARIALVTDADPDRARRAAHARSIRLGAVLARPLSWAALARQLRRLDRLSTPQGVTDIPADIGAAPSAAAEQVGRTEPMPDVQPLVERLARLLREDDSEAADAAAALHHALAGTGQAATARQIVQAVDRIDFRAAAQLLQTLQRAPSR